MAHLDVAHLLDSLRQHGTIDSQGEFTLSLSEARRKLTHFGSSNRRRYLLLLVSAGFGAGATAAHIRRRGPDYHLDLPGASFQESHLLGSVTSGRHSDSQPGSADLLLGLHNVLAEGAEQVAITGLRQGSAGFRWLLGPDQETSETVAPADRNALEVAVSYPQSWSQRVRHWLGGRQSYAGLPEELRLLSQCCDLSDRPITIDDQPVHRPIFLTSRSPYAHLGPSTVPVEGGGLRLELTPPGWRGVLALGPGALRLVVRGVQVGSLQRVALHGVLYHDQLRLDLSRENLVLDALYEELLEELERCHLELVERALVRHPELSDPVLASFLPEALRYAIRGQLHPEAQAALGHSLKARLGEAGEVLPCEPGLLAEQALRLAERGAPWQGLTRVVECFLERCAQRLQSNHPATPETLSGTLDLLQRCHPEQTLMPGYLLLGLGAYLSGQGQEALAQTTWMRALDTVRAGRDLRAEELIHAHMDFPVDHMRQEAARAILLFLSQEAQLQETEKRAAKR